MLKPSHESLSIDDNRSALIVTKQKRRKRPNALKREQGRNLQQKAANSPHWLWGTHAVEAALGNPDRTIHRVLATQNAKKRLPLHQAEDVSVRDLERILPDQAVHQGLAALMSSLAPISLAELIKRTPSRIAVLDQVSDPHNLGAVLRSAAAFGVDSVVLQTRHAPAMTGIVAKTAAGAVERVTECRTVNLARALNTLEEAGYYTIGLTGKADATLSETIPAQKPIALVFGAEGKGLRPAVAKACTWQAHIPMSPGMESLNISNAAAIAFYEAARPRST